MSNLRDYVKDYYDTYPWFSAIFPNITHNGSNISQRVGILRQAAWVLKQILESKVAINDNGNTLLNGNNVANSFDKLTKEDLSLLGIVLKQTNDLMRLANNVIVNIAGGGIIDDSNYENFISFLNRIDNVANRNSLLISKTKDPLYNAIIAAGLAQPTPDTVIVVGAAVAPVTAAINAAVAATIASEQTKANTIYGAAAAVNIQNLVTAAIGTVNAAFAAALNPVNTPRLISEHIAKHYFHSLRRAAAPVAVGAVIDTPVSPVVHLSNATMGLRTLLYHFAGNDKLDVARVNCLAKLASVSTERMAVGIPLAIPVGFNPTYNQPPSYHLFNKSLSQLLSYDLTRNAIFIGDSVSLPYLNSFLMYKDSVAPKDDSMYYFKKDDNGVLELHISKDNVNEVFKYDGIVENGRFCPAFGSNRDDVTGITACAELFDVCLRGDASDKDACKTEFKRLSSVSNNLRAWHGYSSKQRKILAHNVLSGLGFTPLIKDGTSLSFSNYSDSSIYSHLNLDQNVQLDKDKFKYIKKLIDLVGDIPLRGTSAKITLPVHKYNPSPGAPFFIPTRLELGGLGGLVNLGNMFGGDNELIGGYIGVAQHAQADVNKINVLLGKVNGIISINKINEINEKLTNYIEMALTIDRIEQMLGKYLVAKSVYKNDVVLTEEEASEFSRMLDEQKNKFMKTHTKVSNLNIKISGMVGMVR